MYNKGTYRKPCEKLFPNRRSEKMINSVTENRFIGELSLSINLILYYY